eukprot:IDg20957t1
MRTKPYFFIFVSSLLFDIFCVRALDPAYGRFPSSFAPIILVWVLLVNFAAYMCMNDVQNRLERLTMSLQIEAEKRQIFVSNGNQFLEEEDAPLGHGIDSEKMRASEEELDSLSFLPTYAFIAAV